jgi:hypothetical protein
LKVFKTSFYSVAKWALNASNHRDDLHIYQMTLALIPAWVVPCLTVGSATFYALKKSEVAADYIITYNFHVVSAHFKLGRLIISKSDNLLLRITYFREARNLMLFRFVKYAVSMETLVWLLPRCSTERWEIPKCPDIFPRSRDFMGEITNSCSSDKTVFTRNAMGST